MGRAAPFASEAECRAQLAVASSRISFRGHTMATLDHVQWLCAALAESPGPLPLTELDLSDTGLGDLGASALAAVLSELPYLSKLLLQQSGLTDVGATALAHALTSHATITHLDCSGNAIGDAGAATLASAIAVCRRLACLDMRTNNLGRAGKVALSAVVLRAPKLKVSL